MAAFPPPLAGFDDRHRRRRPLPFTPLKIEGRKIAFLGRDLELEANGLPGSIRSYFAPEVTHLTAEGRPLLAGPIQLVMEMPDGSSSTFRGADFTFLERSTGMAAWRSTSRGSPICGWTAAGTGARRPCCILPGGYRRSGDGGERPAVGDSAAARSGPLHDGHGAARRPTARCLPAALEPREPPGQRLAGRRECRSAMPAFRRKLPASAGQHPLPSPAASLAAGLVQ